MNTFQKIKELLNLIQNTEKIKPENLFTLEEIKSIIEKVNSNTFSIEDLEENEFANLTIGKTKTSKSYLSFRTKLLWSLEAALLFSRANKKLLRPFDIYSIESSRGISLLHLFYRLKKNELAAEYAKENLKKSQKASINIFSLFFIKFLKRNHLFSNAKISSFLKYEKLFEETLSDYLLEIKALEYYQFYIAHFNKGQVHLPSTEKKLSSLDKSFFSGDVSPKSVQTIFLYYVSFAFHEIYENRVQSAIQIAQVGLFKLESKEPDIIVNMDMKISFLCTILQCYIHLHNYVEGKKTLTKAYQIQGQLYTHNYFTILELEIALNLRCGHYQDALENYLTYYNHKHKKNIYAPNKESWVLYEAYIYFLTKAKLVDSKKLPDHIQNRRFRMGKFLNEVPRYSKDKKGMNVAVLFAQIIIFLAERKYELVIDRMDALKSYRYRHLKKNSDMYRSNLFIRMLEFLPETGFDKKRSDWRAQQYLKKLEIPPNELPYKVSEIEIIKFEKLWKHVLEQLPSRRPRHYSNKATELPK